MSRDEVEFLAWDGLVASEDDVVEFGNRKVPRLVSALAGLAVTSIVIALLVARGERHAPDVLRTPGPSETRQLTPPPPPVGLGPALILPASPVVDAVVSPQRLYTLQFSQLTSFMVGLTQGVSPDGLDFDRIGGAVRLVLDAARNRLWIVVVNTPNGQILEFDAGTLRTLRRATWAQPIASATAMDGVLYFTTPSGVAAFAPGEEAPVLVAALRGHTGVIVADPKRSRLLVLDHAARSRLRAYRPGHGMSAAAATLAFNRGTVVVTGNGKIWAGGFGTDGAVLTRLDPTTLQPLRASATTSQLGPGADVVAAGESDIWVRNGTGGTPLFCVDGDTGRDNEHWNDLPGGVTSRKGAAYIAYGTTVRPLTIGGCAG